MKAKRSYREPVLRPDAAIHEAGHAVISFLRGLGVGEVSIAETKEDDPHFSNVPRHCEGQKRWFAEETQKRREQLNFEVLWGFDLKAGGPLADELFSGSRSKDEVAYDQEEIEEAGQSLAFLVPDEITDDEFEILLACRMCKVRHKLQEPNVQRAVMTLARELQARKRGRIPGPLAERIIQRALGETAVVVVLEQATSENHR
jgi:hypothetical protein